MFYKRKVGFISLGCAKNLVDSEEIMGSLLKAGYELEPEIEKAEIVIINTCAFLRKSRIEALETIKEMVRLKDNAKSKLQKIVVAGCLVQYIDKFNFKKHIPGVDLFIPIKEYEKLPFFIDSMFAGEGSLPSSKADICFTSYGKNRFLSGSLHSVYIKIAEGCNNRCSYCLIPFLRGPLQSKRIEDITDEVKAVIKLGAQEINLIAQDTTAYGFDIYGKPSLAELLQHLCKIKGLKWIRILYTHPAHITDELLEIIQREPKVCKYLDMPVQHISNKILKLMNRKTTKEEIVSLYNKIRRQMPEIVLRTTVITGFPGEGEEEFNELLFFLREHPFERLGAFTFSPEKGTAACKLPFRVNEEIAEKRRFLVMKQQKKISRSFNRLLLGDEVEVLVDSYDPRKNKAYGRMANQAPEVDGKVIVKTTKGKRTVADASAFWAKAGDLLKVKIVAAGVYDLFGTCSL